MASYTCPKCDITLKRGSWELVEACPDCATPWETQATAPARNLRRVQVLASLFAVLSFVPYLGIVFGMLGVFWAYMAIKFRHVLLGVPLIIVSTVVGLVGQSALINYEVGQHGDRDCESRLTTLSASIRGYHEKNGYFPESIGVLKSAGFSTPAGCFAGGKYLYLPPWSWKVGDGTGTSRPSMVELSVLTSTTESTKAPAMRAPAPSEDTIPEAWASGVPAEYLGALYAASLEVVKLPVPRSITEAENPSTVIMVAEITPAHRYERFCVMADFSVRSLAAADYDKLMQQPQNVVMAKVLEGARKASGDQTIGKAAKKAAEGRAKQSGGTAPPAKVEVEPAPRAGH